jgi:hypothetical protein
MSDMKTQGWVPVKIGNEEIMHVSAFQVEYLKALIADLPPPPPSRQAVTQDLVSDTIDENLKHYLENLDTSFDIEEDLNHIIENLDTSIDDTKDAAITIPKSDEYENTEMKDTISKFLDAQGSKVKEEDREEIMNIFMKMGD